MHTIPFSDINVNDKLADVPNPLDVVKPGIGFLCNVNAATGDANASLILLYTLMYQLDGAGQWISIDGNDTLFDMWMPLPRANHAFNLLIDLGLMESLDSRLAPDGRYYFRVDTAALDILFQQIEHGYKAGVRLPDEEWKWLKKRVLHRYNCRCHYCGEKDEIMHVDHKIPIAKGGDNSFHNLVPACKTCNLRKGVSDYESFRDLMKEKREESYRYEF